MAQKVTGLDDVLSVIADFSAMVAARFDEQDAKFFGIEQNIKELKSDMAEVKEKVEHIYSVLDSHMKRIEYIRTTRFAIISKSAWNAGFSSWQTK